jgi:hypothetical protein
MKNEKVTHKDVFSAMMKKLRYDRVRAGSDNWWLNIVNDIPYQPNPLLSLEEAESITEDAFDTRG